MKFIISSKRLQASLTALSRVVNSKNTISILQNFLFEIVGGKVIITASDSETTITATVDSVEAEGEGSFAVNADRLLGLIKELPDQPVTVDVNEGNLGVTVNYASGHFDFIAVDGDQYPRKADLGEATMTLTIPQSVASKGIYNTLYATGSEDLRRIMTGVLWDIAPDSITFVASDTNKLVRYRNSNVKPGFTASFVLPAKPAGVLSGVLTNSDEPVTISFDSKSATMTMSGYSMTCRFINGRYPNYNSVIPDNNPYTIIFDRQSLLNAVRRVSVFSVVGGLVKFDLSAGSILLTAEDRDMGAFSQESVACQYSGEPMQIGLNGQRVIEILGNLTSDNVTLKLKDPSRAGVFIPDNVAEGEDHLVLLMPMML